MGSINFEEDIRPLSEFRANTASMVKQIKKTGRPLVLTQHGKSTVVLLDVGHYQSLVSCIERFDGVTCSCDHNLPSGS
ncbi:MAG: type II toxin-antitoxin system Phd/YefM family antitoxin [Chlorobiales bacterium]|jgi:prevent-host-death family protein|nr:type II toxin-antitoxin system Phd/YefM family antitoxin [Chlorobiales bacterium]